jgi:SOS response regulatory protein OraA/RecX
VAKALSLLSYTDNNKKRLFSKLVMAGFSSEAASYAVKDCVMHGYVNEERQIEHLIIRYHRELNGPARIFSKLSARGYDSKQIRKVLAQLTESGDVDFGSAKETLISKKLGSGASAEEIKKLLYKHGYSHHD